MKSTMAQCPTEDVLLDYIAGHLDAARSALFEEHAGSCATCAELRNGQAAVWQSLDEWKPAPVSEGFNRELWRRIDTDAASLASGIRRFAESLRLGLWKRVAPLGVALAVIVAGFVLDHSAKQTGIPRTPATAFVVVTASDADQLERTLDDIQLLHEVDAASVTAKPGSGLM